MRLFQIFGAGQFAVISLEDLIADRMGQYHSGSAADMLDQARTIFADFDYLEQRIRQETLNDYGIADLVPKA